MKRTEINACLAVFLFIFGIIGFFIYICIWYSKEPDKCVHCRTQCQVASKEFMDRRYSSDQDSVISTKGSYCPLCGAKLDNRNPNFCSSCGTNLND